MLHALLVNIDGEEGEHLLGIFTDPDQMLGYMNAHVPPDGHAYSVAEYMENVAGIRKQVDLAIVDQDEPPPMALPPGIVTPNPIEAVYKGPIPPVRTAIPFDMSFINTDGKVLLHLFETGQGILDAQFRPEDLSEAATLAVREMMKLFRQAGF